MARRRGLSGDIGATAVEYALLVGLIAVVVLTGVVFVGRSVSGSFEQASLAIGGAEDGGAGLEDGGAGLEDGGAGLEDGGAGLEDGGAAPPVAPVATWERLGNSANFNWECANGFNLGNRQDVQKSSVAPGPAPSCA
jgi:pilus assembly protein Flp/PilA